MLLKDFIKTIRGVAYTVGCINGSRWLYYNDGNSEPNILEDLLNREVIDIYPRGERKACGTLNHLNEGLAIIISGNDCGIF